MPTPSRKKLVPVRPMWVTYALLDPRHPAEGSVFYVGVTNDWKKRYIAHINCDEVNLAKNAIIEELLSIGMLPTYHRLEVSPTKELGEESERNWIEAFLTIGEPLTNWQATGRQR